MDVFSNLAKAIAHFNAQILSPSAYKGCHLEKLATFLQQVLKRSLNLSVTAKVAPETFLFYG